MSYIDCDPYGMYLFTSGEKQGIGEKLFAIPWSALKLDTVKKRFTLDISKDRLEAAPGFDKDAWPRMADESWAMQVHAYYKAKPFWH